MKDAKNVLSVVLDKIREVENELRYGNMTTTKIDTDIEDIKELILDCINELES